MKIERNSTVHWTGVRAMKNEAKRSRSSSGVTADGSIAAEDCCVRRSSAVPISLSSSSMAR